MDFLRHLFQCLFTLVAVQVLAILLHVYLVWDSSILARFSAQEKRWGHGRGESLESDMVLAESCPRHFLVHQARRCPPSTAPDFLGTDTPTYTYGYSAYQHRYGNSQIIKVLAYCAFPPGKQLGLYCTIQFVGQRDYVRGVTVMNNAATFTFDRNAHGQIHNILFACLYPPTVPMKTQAESVRLCVNDTTLTTLPVQKLYRPEYRKSVAVCLPRVYNTPYCEDCVSMNYTYHLPEWIEMQKLMGVDRIFAYNQSMNEDASRIFNYYARLGVVEILSHKPIGNETYMSTSLGVTDCMLRNRYAFDYILVLDMDEFLFSPKWDTYQEIIAALMYSNSNFGKYKQLHFTTAHFHTTGEHATVSSAEPYLRTMSYTHYQFMGYKAGGKSITNPRYCQQIVIPHECSGMGKSTLKVEPSLAMVHHYKGCSGRAPYDRAVCEKARHKEWPATNVTRRFHGRLRKAVQKAFHELKLWGF